MSNDSTKTSQLSPAKQALLERMRKRAALTVAPVIRPRSTRDGAPLSFAQQRLWLIQQLDPQSYLYNVPRALHIRGQLDVQALEKALTSIIKRHEILRTTFPADENGRPWQRIASEFAIKLSVTDLSSVAEDRDAVIQSRVLEFGRRPFDLAN